MNKEAKNIEEQKDNYITIGDIFISLKKNIVLIIFITIAITILGVIYTFGFAKEKYESSTVIIVATESNDADVDLNNSLRLISTVASLVTKDIVLENVASKYVDVNDKVALNTYIANLRNSISVSSSEKSFLITISVKNSDKNLTEEQANLIAESIILVCNDTNGSISHLLLNSINQVSKATVGTRVAPNEPLYLIVSFFCGAILASIVALCLELFSNKFKSKKDIECNTNEQIIGELFYGENGSLDLSKIVNRLIDIEPFNKVFTNITLLDPNNQIKTIMTTSTTSGELKSTLSSGLALAITKSEKKVIVVDLDLRLPSIHKVFHLEKYNGIAEYILGNIEYEDLIKHTKNGIDVITAGKIPANDNPVNFIESSKLIDLVNRLKDNYDYVLFDAPPVLPCNDSLIIATKVDGVIYNVAIDKARKKDFKECLYHLKMTDCNLLGLCATRLKMSKFEEKNYYYYGENYNHHKNKRKK